MTPEVWHVAKAILPRLVGQSPTDQERLVREALPHQAAVWGEVLRLARATRHLWATSAQGSGLDGNVPQDTRLAGPGQEITDASEGIGGVSRAIFSPGERCGPYLIIDLIGEGGMGQVFLAHDTRTARPDLPPRKVALKCLSGRWLASGDARRTLMQEAQGAAAVGSHPNLATLYDILDVEPGPLLVLVMEYVDGSSLSDVVGQGRLPWRRALMLAKQIAEGVGHAHDSGVLHCDIKADNVRVTSRNQAKLLDFGLSRAKAKDLPADSRSRLGTLPYMAPERLIDGELTVAGDIYSLGVTMYELVTGRRPFAGSDELALIVDILSSEPARPSTLVPELPPRVNAVIERALHRDPRGRHQSARELILELDGLLHVRERTWADWTILSVIAALVTLVLFAVLGFVTSTFLDTAMGRTGRFRTETAWLWPLWGARATVVPIVAMAGTLLVFSLVDFAAREVGTIWRGPLSRALAPRHRLSRHLGVLRRPQFLLLAQIAAFAAYMWYFAPFIRGMFALAPGSDGAGIAILSRTASDAPDQFRLLMSVMAFVFGMAWARVAGGAGFWRQPHNRLPAIGGATLLFISLCLLVAPYRVINHNDSERVCHGDDVCYLAGQGDGEILLFCPMSRQRRRLVSTSDTSLRRTGIVENVFSVYEPLPVERCSNRATR